MLSLEPSAGAGSLNQPARSRCTGGSRGSSYRRRASIHCDASLQTLLASSRRERPGHKHVRWKIPVS